MKPKPCPFCGSEDVELCGADGGGRFRWFECIDCCATGPSRHNADEALTAWNTRPQEKEETP